MEIKNSRNKFAILELFNKRKTIIIVTILFGFAISSITSFSAGYLFLRSGNTLQNLVDFVSHPKYSTLNYIRSFVSHPAKIYINIPFKNYKVLEYQNELASKYKGGHRVHPLNPGFTDGYINYKNINVPAKFKIKGGTVTHHKNIKNKWSLKIKVKGEKSLLGMMKFSISNPTTEHYLNEWIYYKLTKYIGLISRRSDFVDVTINGYHKGIYFIVEDMGKELLEYNKRRNGPIFRLDSNYIWEQTLAFKGNIEARSYHTHTERASIFKNSSINLYDNKEAMNDSLLIKYFDNAKNLFEAFRSGDLSASKVFDIKKMASLLCIADLFGNDHSIGLWNLKFYYNPITSKIEPVPYDQTAIMFPSAHNFSSDYTRRVIGESYQINKSNSTYNYQTGFATFTKALFSDENFYREYLKCLNIVSKKNFLDNFFAEISGELSRVSAILNKEYPSYDFANNKYALYQNQEVHRMFINRERSLNVYFEQNDQKKQLITLEVGNVSLFPIEIKGIKIKDVLNVQLDKSIILQAHKNGKNVDYVSVAFSLPDSIHWQYSHLNDLKIEFNVLGIDKTKYSGIIPWSRYDKSILNDDFAVMNKSIYKHRFMTINDDKKVIKFIPGNWIVTESIVLPKGYVVFCSSGTTIDLKNGSSIISYSPLIFDGSADQPIIIKSSDSTGRGMAVIQSKINSHLNWVDFNNLNNPQENNWILTGAVTFFESPVHLSHCRFESNRGGDDYLNILNTEFILEDSNFMNTTFDALDVDYSKGRIINTSFENIGNDALDISGSIIDFQNNYINIVGDKGLSIGENSRLIGKNISINNANIAIASKDLSSVEISELRISNSEVGLAAYQKKPEYGPASIIINNLFTDEVKTKYILQKESKMIINKNKVTETEVNASTLLN